MSFIDSEFIDAVTKGNIKMVLKAIESGVDISREIVFYPKPGSFSHLEIGGLLEAMPIKKNPLKIALENYQADVAKILLERGAILKNEHDKNPWNDILLGAAQKGSIDIALLALEKGAEVNCRGLHSSNPLILASVFGHVEIVKLLISKKSDLNSWSTDPYLPSRRLRTALMWASSEGHKEVVKILKEAGAIE